MKLKSLLLGSAAAMMTVSGANAADAVFAAEPEPMEYVKVCDTYGEGFFYIPGTETCMRIGGYVRTDFVYRDNGGPGTTTYSTTSVATGSAVPSGGTLIGTVGGADIYSVASTPAAKTTEWRYRGRLNIDARNETDWGTLRSQLRIQGGNASGGGDANAVVDRALIQLGGLRLGYSDTFFTTNHGYGLSHGADTDGYYNYDQAIFLDYTFAANGFSATIGVQDSTSTAAISTAADPYDAYFGASYSAASFGRVAGTVIYDSSANELAWKVSADITAIENLLIHAWYSGDNGSTRYVTGYLSPAAYAAARTQWQWGASIAYTLNSQLTVWGGYTDADFKNAGLFSVGTHWNPVSGLSIRPEAVFGEGKYKEFRLRVVRSF